MNKIELAKQKMEAALKEMQVIGKEGLCEALGDLTKSFPLEFESMTWVQYTDYFNDGDTCHFHVRADSYCMDFNGVNGDELEEENPALFHILFEQVKERNYYTSRPELEAVEKFLNNNETFLKQAIGDHSRVTYYRPNAEGGERIEVEDYSDHN